MIRLFAGIAVVLLATSAWADDSIGKLTNIQGKVFTRAPGGSADAPATAGVSLAAGTLLRTGDDGLAEVTFTDGSLLKLQKNSSVQLSPNKRQKQKTSVLLFFGRLWNKVSPSTTGEQSYEVNTPNAVCGVRGTAFETAVGDDGSVRMQVTEGKVAVEGDGSPQVASAGEQVEANEGGVSPTEKSAGDGTYDKWKTDQRERLRTDGERIVKSVKGKIMDRKGRLEDLRKRQQDIEGQRKSAESRARSGDAAAINELKKLNGELAAVADEIASIGDEAQAQFGLVDHFADLAGDPRFKMVGRKNIEAEAASLRRIKADLDKMVAEGTDISAKAMDQMMKDMGKGKATIRDSSGSSAKDLFGDDPADMR
jgi:hypothetical protein